MQLASGWETLDCFIGYTVIISEEGVRLQLSLRDTDDVCAMQNIHDVKLETVRREHDDGQPPIRKMVYHNPYQACTAFISVSN